MNEPIVCDVKKILLAEIESISAFDSLEREHLVDTLNWVHIDDNIYRGHKPDYPKKHLVCYFVPVDLSAKKILLVDHRKACLWLPPGGHVEFNEHPKDTVIRESVEELRIIPDFVYNTSFFITQTETVGKTPKHTDVTLWYLIKGDSDLSYNYDNQEFTDCRWFGFNDLPYFRCEKHLSRFVTKLENYLDNK